MRQLADGLVAQSGDPIEADRLQVRLDARLGDHAAISHQGDPLQAEAVPQAGHLAGEGVGIGGVAGEALHGAALGVAQQAVDDLRAIRAVVARVPALGQRAARALEVAG